MSDSFRIMFEVPGNPIPKQRARAKAGQGGYYAPRARGSARMDYPDYKEHVRSYALGCLVARGLTRGGAAWPSGALWGLKVTAWVGAGDGDNLLGGFADALQGILWRNDSRVRRWECYVYRNKPKDYRGALVEAWVLEEG